MKNFLMVILLGSIGLAQQSSVPIPVWYQDYRATAYWAMASIPTTKVVPKNFQTNKGNVSLFGSFEAPSQWRVSAHTRQIELDDLGEMNARIFKFATPVNSIFYDFKKASVVVEKIAANANVSRERHRRTIMLNNGHRAHLDVIWECMLFESSRWECWFIARIEFSP